MTNNKVKFIYLALAAVMVAVMAHEAVHVVQFGGVRSVSVLWGYDANVPISYFFPQYFVTPAREIVITEVDETLAGFAGLLAALATFTYGWKSWKNGGN